MGYIITNAQDLASAKETRNNSQAKKIARTIDEAINKLAPMINSFRLDCHDCLNPDCKHRDLDFPVEEVQERAKQFEESEQ